MSDEVELIDEDDERNDPYLAILAEINHPAELDQRVVAHEIGHLLIDRTTGNNSISYISVTPQDGHEGICRGTVREALSTESMAGIGCVEASEVRKMIVPDMPLEGEDRRGKSNIHQAVVDACVHLMGGEAAEELLLGEKNSNRSSQPTADGNKLACRFLDSRGQALTARRSAHRRPALARALFGLGPIGAHYSLVKRRGHAHLPSRSLSCSRSGNYVHRCVVTNAAQ